MNTGPVQMSYSDMTDLSKKAVEVAFCRVKVFTFLFARRVRPPFSPGNQWGRGGSSN